MIIFYLTFNLPFLFYCRDHRDFTTLATTSILPVDLNAFILGVCCSELSMNRPKNYLSIHVRRSVSSVD